MGTKRKKEYDFQITHLIQTDPVTKEQSRIKLQLGQNIGELLTPDQQCGIDIKLGIGLLKMMRNKDLITTNEFNKIYEAFTKGMLKEYGLTTVKSQPFGLSVTMEEVKQNAKKT